MRNRRNPAYDWKDLQGRAHEVLGQDFWNQISGAMPKRGPAVDIYRTDREIIAVVELPGISPRDKISIKVRGYKLLISGSIPWIYPATEEDMVQSERFIGEFRREIDLPNDVAPNGVIDAKFKNGLIEIHIPRVPGSDDQDIPIDFNE
jgi:HSP20 family protein